MLAIVVPTIIATLGFAYWFRATNTRASLPTGVGLFRQHRAGRLGDPPAHDRAARRRGLDRFARARSGDAWPRTRHRSRSRSCRSIGNGSSSTRTSRSRASTARRPGRRAAQVLADLGERDERLLRPAARQHDLHDERHGDAASICARTCRRLPGAASHFSGEGFSDMISTCSGIAGSFREWVERRRTDRCSTTDLPRLSSKAWNGQPEPFGSADPTVTT